jgi:hypothetical protein
MSDEQPDNPANQTIAPSLTPVEARVLGCLMEKQRITPDVYPLTLNALVQACNQKTSRHPVMSLTAGEVGHTANLLRDRGLIQASFAGRAERYDHKMASGFKLDRREQALICALMLRGPQTVGELRTNSGRMAELPDLEAVEAILAGLEERDPPLIVRLPRPPGRREERFAHLLCGEVAQELPVAARPSADPDTRDERSSDLRRQVDQLRKELDALWELTGLGPERPSED